MLMFSSLWVPIIDKTITDVYIAMPSSFLLVWPSIVASHLEFCASFISG